MLILDLVKEQIQILDSIESYYDVGLDPDRILEHKNRRQYYLVSFVNNLNDVLLGIDEEPDYISLENAKKKQT